MAATVPSLPAAWAVGKTRASSLELMRLVSAFLLAPPIAELVQGVAQNISTSTFTTVTFDTEVVDSAGGHSNVTNNTRYTAVYPGYYQLSGGVGFAANATGTRLLLWQVNGSTLLQGGVAQPATPTLVTRVPARTIQTYLNVGDYVELSAWQNTGGTLATSTSLGDACSMSVRWVSN